MENEIKTSWDEVGFEEAVAAGILCQFENYKCKEKKKQMLSQVKPFANYMNVVRDTGIYFPPSDREILTHFDFSNDILPNTFSLALLNASLNGEKSYVGFSVGYKIANFEKGWICDEPRRNIKAIYSITDFSASYDGKKNFAIRSNIAISETGEPIDTYYKQPVPIGFNRIREEKIFYRGDGITTFSQFGIVLLNFSVDRRFLWNVEAIEGGAKCIFGVYPEMIKSLFYARSLPMTKTGRKSPILHWVHSHKRRLKDGIDINIDSHLRGITDFEMDGTKFIITNPVKRR